ncbi:hypothetical protein ACLOJK_020817 [Asimina triloba]
MGNKLAKQEQEIKKEEERMKKKKEVMVKAVPPVDRALLRWLAKDVRRIHDFAPLNPSPIKPPDHYIEYMRLYGWLDLDINDPDLAHLFK